MFNSKLKKRVAELEKILLKDSWGYYASMSDEGLINSVHILHQEVLKKKEYSFDEDNLKEKVKKLTKELKRVNDLVSEVIDHVYREEP